MLFGFAIIILLLCATIIFLAVAYRRIRKLHDYHVAELNAMIVQLAIDQGENSLRLNLSDELLAKLNTARLDIDSKLMDVQHDMARTISENSQAG